MCEHTSQMRGMSPWLSYSYIMWCQCDSTKQKQSTLLRYDMPIFLCAQKLTGSQLSLPHITKTTKKVANIKTNNRKTDEQRNSETCLTVHERQFSFLCWEGFVVMIGFESGMERDGVESVEWGWCSKTGSWFQRWGDEWRKERFVILRDKETDGQRTVVIVEERVEWWGWTEIRSLQYVGWEVVRTSWVTERSLYSGRSLILSQWRDLRIGEVCENLRALTTACARVLSILKTF